MLFEILLKKGRTAGHDRKATVVLTVRELAHHVSNLSECTCDIEWDGERDSANPECSVARGDRHFDLPGDGSAVAQLR